MISAKEKDKDGGGGVGGGGDGVQIRSGGQKSLTTTPWGHFTEVKTEVREGQVKEWQYPSFLCIKPSRAAKALSDKVAPLTLCTSEGSPAKQNQ